MSGKTASPPSCGRWAVAPSTARPLRSTPWRRPTPQRATPSPSSSPSVDIVGWRITIVSPASPATGVRFRHQALRGTTRPSRDQASHRTMNDHIHLLEAYAELLRVSKDPALQEAHRGAPSLHPRSALRRTGLPLSGPRSRRKGRPVTGLVRPRRGDRLSHARGRRGPRPQAGERDSTGGTHARGPCAPVRSRSWQRPDFRHRQRLRKTPEAARPSGGLSSRR